MKTVLVLYGTIEGQTRKIAEVIADVLKQEGLDVDLIDSGVVENIQIDRYDAIIAGASVHASKYPKKFIQIISKHAGSFSKIPSAFFSVCLGILQTDEPETIKAEHDFVTHFFSETGWRPAKWTIFPGALRYSKYSWFTRHLMQMISKKAGRITNRDQDYEYTQWNEVKSFARDFARDLATPELSL